VELDLTGPKSSVFHKLDPDRHMDLTRACVAIHDPHVRYTEGRVFADLSAHLHGCVVRGQNFHAQEWRLSENVLGRLTQRDAQIGNTVARRLGLSVMAVWLGCMERGCMERATILPSTYSASCSKVECRYSSTLTSSVVAMARFYQDRRQNANRGVPFSSAKRYD